MTKRTSSSSAPSIPAIPRGGLLIIDDQPEILRVLEQDLKLRDYEMIVTDSPNTALEILELQTIGVVLSDYRMPKMNGIAFLDIVRSRWPNIQRIMMAAADELPTLSGVQNIFRFVSKPWDQDELVKTIDDAFQIYGLLRENAELWALSQRQYRDLQTLNHSLETKIAERTQQVVSAKVVWERTFDAIVDPLAIVSDDFEVVRANLAYADHAQRKVNLVPGQKCFEMIAGRDLPCDSCPITMKSGLRRNRGVDIPATEGRVLHVWSFPMQMKTDVHATDAQASTQHNVCYYRDVTEERELEVRLSQTEKLASIGLFVGGVSHEVNSPLGSIIALTDTLKEDLADDEDSLEVLNDIGSSADRCRRIIDSLRSFVHGSAQAHRDRIQVDEIVAEVVIIFQRDYGSAGYAAIECEIRGEIPAIRGDVALLHQLFRNLLQNAYHSLPPKSGRIDVSVCDSSSLGTDDCAGMVMIEVKDNGSGISPENLKHVFEPFFTTKGENKVGSGLGLSISHQIVLKHRGKIDVESTEGIGTRFRIELPVGEATGSYRLAELKDTK